MLARCVFAEPINPSTAGSWMDEDGMGTREPAARTPSGQFYDIPRTPVDLEELTPGEGGWQSFGHLEFGAIEVDGDVKSQGFRNDQHLESGAVIESFGFSAEQPDQARYLEIVGGSVGRNDQSYGLRLGRYNDWKLNLFYNETPHVYTSAYRSLWSGLGTDRLTLESGLPLGGAASAAATRTGILNVLSSTDEIELGVTRRKAGLRFDTNLSASWKFYSSYSEERREGARPFGAVFGGGGGGGNIEVAESIDYTTRDLLAGVQYADAVNRFNLQATASIFRNNVDTLTFDNPLYINLNGIAGLNSSRFPQGRFDLAPSNEHYHLKGEYGRSLPSFYKGNFTATLALGSMRQDDRLIPPSPYALTGGMAQGVSLADNWNTVSALSRDSAEARTDTRMANLALALKPTSALGVKGKLRYYETQNHTEYWACNPLTGQWGRLLNDGSGVSLLSTYTSAACNADAARALNLVPTAGNIPVRSAPYDYQQVNAGVSADYRLGKTSSVNAAVERETYRREHRERDRTWEDKLKLGYVNRGLIDGTVRLSAEHGRRRGSEFKADPTAPFLSESFGPQPSTNGVNLTSWLRSVEQLQRYDLADRDQSILNARVNYLFLPSLEGGVTLQWKDAEYLGEVGRVGHQKQGSLAFDLDFKAGPKAVLYGFYGLQAATMEQRGVESNACVMGQTYYFYSDGQVLAPATIGGPAPATPAGTTLVATQTVSSANWESVCGSSSATSPLFPEGNAWDVRTKDRNHTLGVGLKYDFGRAQLDANFTRSLGRTRIGYAYNAAALGLNPTQEALAGDGFSDLRFAQNVLSLSVLVPISKRASLRFLGRYETGVVRDWHYDGVAANPMPTNNAAYLDAGPQDYSVTLLGVLLLVRL
jgi:MtrB/PioB family decaheme-associated outer membrane protein